MSVSCPAFAAGPTRVVEEDSSMLDLVFVALTVVLFAVLALVVWAVERL